MTQTTYPAGFFFRKNTKKKCVNSRPIYLLINILVPYLSWGNLTVRGSISPNFIFPHWTEVKRAKEFHVKWGFTLGLPDLTPMFQTLIMGIILTLTVAFYPFPSATAHTQFGI